MKTETPIKGWLTITSARDAAIATEVIRDNFYLDQFTGVGEFTLRFTPQITEVSSPLMKGLYITVLWDGQTIYVMPDSYPPRLTVKW